MIDMKLLVKVFSTESLERIGKDNALELALLSVYDLGWSDGYERGRNEQR